jgi:tetraacyldisaccharide 4'-kinase
VRLEPPAWWYQAEATPVARLLDPIAKLVAAAAERRFARTKPYRSRLPIICVGNLTAGGAGKTPLALCIAELLWAARRKPGFLTRGYGGRIHGPHQVRSDRDTAADVGDEALLLARKACTVVSRDRVAGAKALEDLGPDIIVMDDGLQNPGLAKQLAIAVLDPQRLIGNGLVMPAGPLRAGLTEQLRRTHALVLLQGPGDTAPRLPPALQSFSGPVLSAELSPDKAVAAALKGRRVLAYAGIGRPSKLFDTLRTLGADLAGTRGFPDHHRYSASDARRLLEEAEAQGAQLVTTEKDFSRLAGSGEPSDLRAASIALPVTAQFRGRDFDRMVGLLDLLLSR